MARILGRRVPGSPRGRTTGMIPSLGSGRVTQDSAAKRGIRRLFARDPSKGAFVNIGTEKDVLGQIVPAKNATLTTALAGTNNDLLFRAKPAGTVGNAYRVRIVVSGANTPLSVSLSGTDLTINSATSAGSAATSTAAQVLAALLADAPTMAKFEVELASGNDGT
ncbi:MAG TPA: hypothetical protein VJQ25_11425, partial [Nitrospira sp.]|nr:hypothetical protein [Nitrospira sp.]